MLDSDVVPVIDLSLCDSAEKIATKTKIHHEEGEVLFVDDLMKSDDVWMVRNKFVIQDFSFLIRRQLRSLFVFQ